MSVDIGSAETERHHSEMGRMVHSACVSTSLWVGYVTDKVCGSKNRKSICVRQMDTFIYIWPLPHINEYMRNCLINKLASLQCTEGAVKHFA